METVADVLVSSSLVTLTLALAALGLAIIYGLIGVINLGHGAMLTIGAYVNWQLVKYGLPFGVSVLGAAAVVAVVGAVFEHLMVRHFYDRPFDTLLLTWGFFLISTEVIKIIFGPSLRTVTNPLPGAFHVFGLSVPAYQSVVALLTVGLLVFIWGMFGFTNIGLKIKALVQNKEVAEVLGLRIARTYKLVFIFGSFLTGLAGALISPMMSVDPYVGNIYLIRSFFVVLVGGLGQLLAGTLVGSFVTGGTETLVALFSNQAVAQTSVFALAILILRIRPDGVLGGSRIRL